MNKISMNINVQLLHGYMFSSFTGKYPGERLQDYRVGICFAL